MVVQGLDQPILERKKAEVSYVTGTKRDGEKSRDGSELPECEKH